MNPNFEPNGFTPAGFNPAPTAPVVVQDLDYDLVAFLAAKLGIKPSPIMVNPGPTRPSITYTLVAEVPITRLSGTGGLAQRTYQIDFRSTDLAVPAQLAEKLRLATQGLRGSFGSNTVRRITYRRLPTGYDQAANKGASGTFRFGIELGFWYRQAHPTF